MPRLPFYYGWVNVVVAAVAMTATLPGRTYGLGLIKEPLRADLGLGDLEFGVLNFWAIVIGAAVVLPVGRLIDRIGTRWTAVLVSIALGVSVLAMSRAADLTTLAMSLTCVRGLGQGALSVVAIAMVGKWFRRRIGVAMGVFTVLLGVGFVAPLAVLTPMIEANGWRSAWAAVGYSLFAFAAIAAVFTRSTPESAGVTPDAPAPDVDTTVGMTLPQALMTPAFWAYSAAGTLYNLVFSAITFDNVLLLKEHGLSGSNVETSVLGALFVAGLAANLLTGWLAKRVELRLLLTAGAAVLGLALAAFSLVRAVPEAIVYGGLLGASGGVIVVVYFAIYAHTFGRAHLGTIQSAVQVFSVFASAVGPVALAYVRQEFGHTDGFFVGFAILSVVLGLLCVFVRPPNVRGGD